jgi:hypothetical protein
VRRAWSASLLLAALFAVVYARSLTFVYVEGDDAMSIAYHAMGRVPALQPPYSPYQSMMDAILGVLAANEPLLRVAAMLLTGLAAPVLVLLIARLALEWAGDSIGLSWPAAALLVPLLAPEFLYLGLVYTPTLLALSAGVGAHLLVRRANALGPRFWLSALLFGTGAACRWDVVAYGGIVAADLAFGPGLPPPRRERIRNAVVWGAAALSSWVLCLVLNGYSRVLLRTVLTAGPLESFPGLPVLAATVQTFATPAFVLCAVTGFVALVRRRNPLSLLALLGIVLVSRYLKFGVPKWIFVAAPGLAACALAGFSLLWNRGLAVRAGLAACIAAPWIFGVHTVMGDTAYGPGYEVRPFDHPSAARAFIRPVAGAGALLPTPEGPRPLGGHAWVLIGGAWRSNVEEASRERTRAIHEALVRGIPILADQGQGYTVATLAGMRFTTEDSWKRVVRQFLEERRFHSGDGAQRIHVLRLRDRESLFTPDGSARLRDLAASDALVIYGYTSTLRRCYRLAPDALEPLGVTAAVLHLEKLRAGAAKMTARAVTPPE